MSSHNLIWVVNRMHVEVEHYPTWYGREKHGFTSQHHLSRSSTIKSLISPVPQTNSKSAACSAIYICILCYLRLLIQSRICWCQCETLNRVGMLVIMQYVDDKRCSYQMWSWWNCPCGVVVQGRCGGDWFLGCRLGQEWYAPRLARSQMQFRWNCCPVHQVINKLYIRFSILTGLLCSWINQEDHIHVELKDYKSLVIAMAQFS